MKNAGNTYEVVIGLEVHVQLSTASKIFCPDSTKFGNPPNFNTGPVSLGHPGTLPVLNRDVLRMAVKLGLATKSKINRNFYFSRKNYFYTDLPKGYQISQDTTPICIEGEVNVKTTDGNKKAIRLTRIHMEEDAGKSIHDLDPDFSLIDLNRAGVPLLEVVTEPDLRSSDEAYSFLYEIRKLARYLEISDGNMEEGSLRCDANVSLRKWGEKEYGTRTEIKNLNSLNNVKKAIVLEIKRQEAIIDAGEQVQRETLHYDIPNDMLIPLRSKEEAHDYRYFPEPDLPPVELTDDFIDEMRHELPSLPEEVHDKMITTYGLSEYDAGVLSEESAMAGYFFKTAEHALNYKSVANWLMGPVKSFLNEKKIPVSDYFLEPHKLAKVIAMAEEGIINQGTAIKKLFPLLEKYPGENPEKLASEHKLLSESDEDELRIIINTVLQNHPDKVNAYRKGKKGLTGFFMGQVMKLSGGKADPKITGEILNELLDN